MKAQERPQEEAATPHSGDFSDHEVAHKSKVTVVGSGVFGCVAAKLIASNTLRLSSFHGIYVLPILYLFLRIHVI